MERQTVLISVDLNLERLLRLEDLDDDLKITKDDFGPKCFFVKAIDGKEIEVKGHYPLSNLLQFLAHAHLRKERVASLDVEKLFQSPLLQVNEQIETYYWDALTRYVDEKGLIEILEDPKRSIETTILYVPFEDRRAFDYFSKCSNKHPYLKLIVKKLPKDLDEQSVEALNKKPGLLSLSLDADPQNGNPYVVPGGRFNEMYGWDTYFIILGLLISNRYDLAFSMYRHLLYQIKYYGKILNANRSYYLTRSQPPFLTSIIKALIEYTPSFKLTHIEEGLFYAILEYEMVWMSELRKTPTGLSRYFGEGSKEPQEVEENHFDSIYKPFAIQKGLSIKEYRDGYINGHIDEPKLDLFFLHDRSMRESGHDTTYRLLNVSADLNPVDLNSLLYKYEKDIEELIEKYFHGNFIGPFEKQYLAKDWREKANKRKEIMNELMWDENAGLYFDYNYQKKKRSSYESATTFYPLFAKCCSIEAAQLLMQKALPLFECEGGLVSSTEKSRGEIRIDRPLRQWDYPFGWAPHQMLFWQGAQNYGYSDQASRLAYKWLKMATEEARDYNGVLVEKYDVVNLSHNLSAEYGNEGLEFGLFPNGGFGWMNASYLYGQKFLKEKDFKKLQELG